MRNIRRKLAAMITAVSVLALTGCNGIGTKEEEKLTIEVSADKVTVEAGQDDTIEIENYDDLEKVKIEVEDDMAEDDVTELHWECDGDILTLNGENKTRECEIDSDGSFTISFTEEEMGEDAAIFAPEGGSFDLVFHR